METVDEVLAHHGVKGMKWGTRRIRAQGSSAMSKSASTHKISDDAKDALNFKTRAKTGGTHTLSNKELQHLVSRMNLEQQYSNLSNQSKKVHKGQKATKDILSVTKTVFDVYNTANSPAIKALRLALKAK